jgi:hypothetical protein
MPPCLPCERFGTTAGLANFKGNGRAWKQIRERSEDFKVQLLSILPSTESIAFNAIGSDTSI